MSADHIERAVNLLSESEQVVELRILNTRRGTVSGYFNEANKLALAASEWNGKAPGIYMTLNPVNPALLSRSANHITEYAKQTTSDADIIKRWWLPIDNDPVRPAGISSTDQEHEAAISRAKEIAIWLGVLGFPGGILADSGNGAHQLFRIDLPNSPEATALIKKCLEAIALRFSDNAVNVDLTCFNAARIWKTYYTLACKGDSTRDRPHRLAKILTVPSTLEVVSVELLQQLATMAPEEPKYYGGRANYQHFDVEAWITSRGLEVATTAPWSQGGRKWILARCPWNGDHVNRSAYIVQLANGAIGAGCHHHGCASKGWQDLRLLLEPGWRGNTDNWDRNFTSDYRDPSSEVKFEREINAAVLQAEATAQGIPPVTYKPFLGRDGYVVKGWSHLVAAFPKTGKTELTVRALADWTDDKVLYVTEEPKSVWQARLLKLPPTFSHVSLFFGLGVQPEKIFERIKGAPETVFILDTIRNLLGLGDETDNSAMARALIPYIAVTREQEKTIFFLHHDRKGGGEHGEGIAGAHAFLAVVDIALEIKRDGPEDSRRRLLRGWGRVVEIPRLIYELQDDGSMVALGSPALVTLEEVKNRVWSVLDEEFEKTKGIRGHIDDPKPSEDQVLKALEALAQEGKAERDPPFSEGKRQGARYKWRLSQNLTSDEPSYRSEVKLDAWEDVP
jgi:AAA domain